MYEGETERIPRATDRGEPDVRDRPGTTAHHYHHHDPPSPASRRVRTLVAALLVPFALAALVGTVLLFPFDGGPESEGGAGRPVNGVITGTETGSCSGEVQVGEQPDAPQCLVVAVRMTDGDAPGQEIRVVVPQEPSTPRFAVDDEVVLSYGGSDPRQSTSYQLVDFQRDVPLALLAGLFAVAVLVLGRWQGLKALVALGLSFLVLVFFVLPAILAGESPLLVAICGAGVIMFAVLYLTHGLSARTSTAVLGTMVSLAMIGVLGALWAAFAKLTGLDEETATLVGLLNAPIDTRGLLLAGVVIGALGVLDDVTVTQTSAVWELRAANPLFTRRELYTSALRIGRDHVASAVNTLVMAYAGAALPLLLYSSISGVGLGSILTSQSIAQELVRTLVGSIGLVAAVPITTALAAAVASQEPVPEMASSRRGSRRDRAGEEPIGERPARRAGRDDERSRGHGRVEAGSERRTERAEIGRERSRRQVETGQERPTRHGEPGQGRSMSHGGTRQRRPTERGETGHGRPTERDETGHGRPTEHDETGYGRSEGQAKTGIGWSEAEGGGSNARSRRQAAGGTRRADSGDGWPSGDAETGSGWSTRHIEAGNAPTSERAEADTGWPAGHGHERAEASGGRLAGQGARPAAWDSESDGEPAEGQVDRTGRHAAGWPQAETDRGAERAPRRRAVDRVLDPDPSPPRHGEQRTGRRRLGQNGTSGWDEPSTGRAAEPDAGRAHRLDRRDEPDEVRHVNGGAAEWRDGSAQRPRSDNQPRHSSWFDDDLE